MSLDGIDADGSKESEIMVGKEGIVIIKNISSLIKSAVENGNLSLTSNGTVFLPDKQSLNFSAPIPSCAKGQALREDYCCKLFEIQVCTKLVKVVRPRIDTLTQYFSHCYQYGAANSEKSSKFASLRAKNDNLFQSQIKLSDYPLIQGEPWVDVKYLR